MWLQASNLKFFCPFCALRRSYFQVSNHFKYNSVFLYAYHFRLSQADGDPGDDGQMDSDGLTMQQREHISFLGDTSSIQLDDLASLTLTDNDLLPEGVSVEELTIFEQMYKEHCRVRYALHKSCGRKYNNDSRRSLIGYLSIYVCSFQPFSSSKRLKWPICHQLQLKPNSRCCVLVFQRVKKDQ